MNRMGWSVAARICLLAFVAGSVISIVNVLAAQWLYLGRPLTELSYALIGSWRGGTIFLAGAAIAILIHIFFGSARREAVFPISRSTNQSAVARYLFRPGGRISLAVCRICLFVSMLFILLSADQFFATYGGVKSYLELNPSMWRSFSILQVFGSGPPLAQVIELARPVGLVATVFAIVGFLTPISMIISTLSCWLFASMTYAYLPTFSHGYNVILLAGFAFMFGPAGSDFSVDATIARRMPAYPFGRPVAADMQLWPVLLGQAAVALFYFGAFYAKFGYSGYLWAFSDNMRFSLAAAWVHPLSAKPLPSFIDWIVNHEFAFVLVAIAHLLSQALTILAVFSVSRPCARLVESSFFVAGVIGLNVFMAGIWPIYWWMPLTAFFIDWDYLAARLKSAPLGKMRTA